MRQSLPVDDISRMGAACPSWLRLWPGGGWVALLCLALLAASSCSPSASTARRTLDEHGVAVSGAELSRRAAAGDSAMAGLLLQAGIPVDSRDSWQRAPLHLAAWASSADLMSLLLSRGAEVDARDAQGRTPLHLAVARVQPDLVRLLLERGADPARADRYGLTPLHRAAWSGSGPLVDLLLQRGVDVRVSDREGDTPLHLAAWMGDEAMVTGLLDRKADANAHRSDGSTPLHVAMFRSDVPLVSLLLARGAQVDARDESGSTCLHRAVWGGNEEAVRLLLQAGADAGARDASGRTPLHRLWLADGEGIVRRLVGRGADLNARDDSGRTPLDCVLANGHDGLARALRALGARPGKPRAVTVPALAPASALPALPAVAPRKRDAVLAGFRERLRGMLARGVLPIIDVEFHYGAITPIEDVLDKMDRNGVGLVWFAANPRLGSEISARLHEAFPERVVPFTCHGQELPWGRGEASFLQGLEERLATGSFFGMGEFECRHYATICNDRDVYTPVDSPQMEAVFELSERHGVPFLLHHEAEDTLLPELERMLARHPRARVVWCHGGRNRNTVTWRRMAHAGFVRSLLERHPNLYLDLVQLPAHPRGEESAPLYVTSATGISLSPAWKEVIQAFPERFLVGTDANSVRLARYDTMIENTRTGVLASLPDPIAARIAFKNAWKLLSGEEWRD